MGHFFRFPLANPSDLPGAQSIFGISQDPPMCSHTSLSQDGFYQKGVWVELPLTSLPFGLQGAFSAHVWSGRPPDFENKKCDLGRAQPSLLIVYYSGLGVLVHRE